MNQVLSLLAISIVFVWCDHGLIGAQPTPEKVMNPYESRYLVVGFKSASGREVIIAADFNRTDGASTSTYEYKVWVGKGTDWQMPVYERFEVASKDLSVAQALWPQRAGVKLDLDEGAAMHMTLQSESHRIELRTRTPSFRFTAEKDGIGEIRTAHVEVVIHFGEEQHTATAVYEFVRYDQKASRQNQEEAAERARRLEPTSFFGLYDWIVLWDEKGRLFQFSAGDQTEDFAYHHWSERSPLREPAPKRVEIRWLQTQADTLGQRHVPLAWQVDVPAWQTRLKLSAIGLHIGHGEPDAGGRRPVYRQIGVRGAGLLAGESVRVFGMVESILD